MAERAAATSQAYELLGSINEQVYALGDLAADIEDEPFSKLVHQLRRNVLSSGRQCKRIRTDLADELMRKIVSQRKTEG